MARRSSRLRQSPAAQMQGTSTSVKPLATLAEREETPERSVGQATAVATPPQSRTPTSTTPVKPSADEMHPDHYHSAKKKQASEMRFGFSGKASLNATHGAPQTQMTPEKHATNTVTATTPQAASSTKPSRPSIASPDYAFTFRHPSTELSSEAQRIMESVRDEAARIRSQLEIQREEQIEKDGTAEAMFGGRKMAQAKSKLGRFSDVHMEQFKKMDSIANHPSSFRANKIVDGAVTQGLKRTNSKVNLGESFDSTGIKPANSKAELSQSATTQSLKRTNSKSQIPSPARPATPKSSVKVVPIQQADDTPEHGPAKRRKTVFESRAAAVEASATSPQVSSPSNSQGSKIPAFARSPSVKSLQSPPTQQHSPSTKITQLPQPSTPSHRPSAVNQPVVPQTEPSRSSRFASKLAPFKSILRKPQLKFSTDPRKQAAGTHLAPPSEPKTPEKKMEKHVIFTPEPAHVHHLSPAPSAGTTPDHKTHSVVGEDSPSPVKHVPSVRFTSDSASGLADGGNMDIDTPPKQPQLAETPPKSVSYPNLTLHAPASAPPKPTMNSMGFSPSPGPANNSFTFAFSPTSKLSFAPAPPKHDPSTVGISRISLAPAPPKTTPSIPKASPTPNFLLPTSASAAKNSTPPSTPQSTIRKVRPSLGPGTPNRLGPGVSGIEHGLSNKKRKRETGDVGSKLEGIGEEGEDGGEEKENEGTPAAKKAKTVPTSDIGTRTPSKALPTTPGKLKERERRMSGLGKSPAAKSPGTRLMSPGLKGPGRLMSPSARSASPSVSRMASPASAASSAKKLSWARLEALAMPKKRA